MESVESTLAGRVLEPRLLASKLAPLAGDYHVIIIDCPPAGGVMTALAMSAVNGLVVPVKADDASAEGLTVLYKQFRVVRESANPELRLLGVVLFGVETGATALRRSLREELERELGDRGPVFESIIRHARARYGRWSRWPVSRRATECGPRRTTFPPGRVPR